MTVYNAHRAMRDPLIYVTGDLQAAGPRINFLKKKVFLIGPPVEPLEISNVSPQLLVELAEDNGVYLIDDLWDENTDPSFGRALNLAYETYLRDPEIKALMFADFTMDSYWEMISHIRKNTAEYGSKIVEGYISDMKQRFSESITGLLNLSSGGRFNEGLENKIRSQIVRHFKL